MNIEWLDKGLRIMQYNLQIRDTAGMDPVKIAEETLASASNAVVINVGGIYAWYRSNVPYHHINEYLPEGRDLLEELISEFHKRDIKVIARFDFSLADDRTYQEHPEWFARDKDMNPMIAGATRMGGWDQLLTTCSLSGYRNEEVAVPILEEVLDRYAIDGIFLNAPTAPFCQCNHCQKEYMKKFGKPLPETIEEVEPDWLSGCTKANIDVLYKAIKRKNENIPLILYYAPFSEKIKGLGISHRDSIYDRLATADYICCEAQNVLSAGIKGISCTEKPSLNMKSGFEPESGKRPFGIIHSCPGMDWRHVGLPKAEYLPWMAQVPASHGVLWHSVTGYPDTILDKNVMEAASEVNHMAAKTEKDMDGAVSYSSVLVLWDGSSHCRDIGSMLMQAHVQFDLMHDFRMNAERMKKYPILFIPTGFLASAGTEDRQMIKDYAADGGRVIVEEMDSEVLTDLAEFFGINPETAMSEYLTAAYLRFEAKWAGKGIGCDKMAFRGRMAYCRTASCEAAATLVPPFAPIEVVGRPPERASIAVPHTDIPLLCENRFGKGSVYLMPFCLDELFSVYHLVQHVEFMENVIRHAGGMVVESSAPRNVQITCYQTASSILIHLVNEVGERPLMDTIRLSEIPVTVRIPAGKKAVRVRAVISGKELDFSSADDSITVVLPSLGIWEMLAIDFE